MKSYTDIEQSKRLKKILPPESADMTWCFDDIKEEPFIFPYRLNIYKDSKDVPAWSLAALLEIIKKPTALDLMINGRGYRCHCTDKSEGKFYGTDDYCDNSIDACIEVIIKLHEQKLL